MILCSEKIKIWTAIYRYKSYRYLGKQDKRKDWTTLKKNKKTYTFLGWGRRKMIKKGIIEEYDMIQIPKNVSENDNI